jgi:predicted GNAT family acetyltransferase
MSDFERAFELMDHLDEAIAERVEPTAHGDLIVDTTRFLVYDRNFLRVRNAGDASAAELAAEAEEAQGRFREIRHRRVNLRGAEVSSRLEPGFVELGWRPERFVVMALRRRADHGADVDVQEVDASELAETWVEAGRSFGGSDELVAQMARHHRGVGETIPTRYFAVRAGDRIAAYCELYSWERIGQVESVVTLAEFRRRGFARAIVLRAVAESLAVGNELTFLVADADDWPKELYEKLGFETIGRYSRFLRPA